MFTASSKQLQRVFQLSHTKRQLMLGPNAFMLATTSPVLKHVSCFQMRGFAAGRYYDDDDDEYGGYQSRQ